MRHLHLDFNEYQIHYYIAGPRDKEAILFLHPAFSDHHAFESQIDFFSGRYQLILVDLIGHGRSKRMGSSDQIDKSAEHIQAILKKESISQVHLMGVSMGSLVAQQFAFEYPEYVKSFAALGGYSIHQDNKNLMKSQMLSNVKFVVKAMISLTWFRKSVAKAGATTFLGQSMFYQSTLAYERKSFSVMKGFDQIIQDRPDYSFHYRVLNSDGRRRYRIST